MVVSSMTRGNYDGDMTQLLIWLLLPEFVCMLLTATVYYRYWEPRWRWRMGGGAWNVLFLPGCMLFMLVFSGLVTIRGLML